MKTSPQIIQFPRERGAITGQIMTEAEIMIMDRLDRIRAMTQPVSLKLPPYSARIDMMVLVAMKAANDPNPPSSPAAAMRRAA